jgi:copper chaperone NosL
MTHLPVRARILVAVAALLLLGLYLVPMWRIQLHAPQYPEGLGLLIRVNTITGIKPADLDNINGLNHYIGMKAIDPEAVPVLAIMPWVVGILALGALIAAATGLRALLVGWVLSFAVAGIAGLVEFYLWSYDYGHNLAADAVIKVPGMSYQPPLIGSKQLLNFTADSWPALGSWLAAAAFMLGVVALLPVWRRPRKEAVASTMPAQVVGALAVLLLFVGACTSAEPPAMAYGRADCDVCRMRITDARFGGEIVTTTGKAHQFDSIECLANYSVGSALAARSVWVSDFERPGTLIPAVTAHFVRRAGPSAGMGANLLAVGVESDTAAIRARYGVAPIGWTEVRALASRGALRDSIPPRSNGRA